MAAHDHAEYVEGCFRCDLSRDEVSALLDAEALLSEAASILGSRSAAQRFIDAYFPPLSVGSSGDTEREAK